MADINLIEAWGIWLKGKSTLSHDMHGIPMVWLGRGGKIAAFFSGMTILLDIIGPERMRSFASRLREVSKGLVGWLSLLCIPVGANIAAWVVQRLVNILKVDIPILDIIVEIVVSILGLAILLFGAFYLILLLITFIEKAFAALPLIFEHPRVVHLKIFAGLLLVIGFHFDLLAS